MTIDILRQVTLFSTLGDNELQALAVLARPITAQRGEIIISQGSVGDALYVVIGGRVRVYVSDKDGKEMVLALEGPSAVFGEIAVLDGAVRSASIAAMEQTELLKISADDFFALLERNTELNRSVIQSLAGRIRKLTQGAQGLALDSVYRRLTARLQECAVEENGEWVITERLTHQLLADMIGCSREMVSRIMSDLVKGGYIRIEPGRWVIERKLPADY
ncbi:Crp/Fnr family transcriptional regulator [Gammaproteobacteria bacterium]|nr:Crp/Fnr family transcriptional regulator [Gammaproteobacteria bacterium]MDG2237727.1 Crp/Fnr family transcriptional regulator [Arenicellales bacterium]